MTTYAEVFYLLLDKYIHWWYVVVAVILLIPQLIGATFWVFWYSEDNHTTRGKLDVALYLTIISYSLLAIWNLIYFMALYKEQYVYIGSDDAGYIVFTKKYYIFWSLFLTAWIISFFGYWVCVARRYHRRLAPKEKKEEDAPAEEMMAAAEDKPAEGEANNEMGGDAPAEGAM